MSAVLAVEPDVEDRCRLQRVLVVDENELLQAGLRAVLVEQPWVASCLLATNAETAWQVAQRHHPQLVVVSTSLGGRSALELCGAFRERMPHVRVVLLSGEGRVSAAMALLHGAVASLSKQMPRQVVASALEKVAEGAKIFPKEHASSHVRLSPRELDILQHVSSGLSNPEVASLLNLSRHTVKQHTSAVYRKLGVRNRAQAASRAQELGLLS
ncbi:response regulator transcription factor [Nocardioides sp. LS1]|uniref:response regulator transcription factor n=1 Tax=Nocardioides sp. LS1 TaxID=1027620 RepID=UPI000F616D12|nr:response regulator transcription factor [Nocardioides sp. LS1]GCD88111.1 DNA-binding response regulator [Nocardioides sp. LS1]